MAVVVTGATGRLGSLVIDELLTRMPPDRVVALARNPARAGHLAASGVAVRYADYDRPETWTGAFGAGDRVLLVSSHGDADTKARQHATVIDAARASGVALLAYTSVLAAPSASFSIGWGHRRTEELVLESGLPYAFLRNGWYHENYTGHLGAILEHGQVFGVAGEGRIAAAARADYAVAAAEVLTRGGQENTVHELSGDTAFTLAEFAQEVSRWSGHPVDHPRLSAQEYRQFMLGQGVDPHDADQLIEADAAIARGALSWCPGDLRTLLGRPTTPVSAAIRAALAELDRDVPAHRGPSR